MNNRAVVTICSINYLPKASVLLSSYRGWHPNDSIFLVIVDKRSPYPNIDHLGAEVIWADELGIDDFLAKAFCFDVIELNTNVKPVVILRLLQSFESVVYLDPDVKVYSELTSVYRALETATIVVTPHSNTPISDSLVPGDVEFLRFGAYNLGFIGVRQCDESFAFLRWWKDRCLTLGFYEPQPGLAVDQKWIDLAPAFFPNLKILHEAGLNVAFWNLHERVVTEQSGKFYVNSEHPLQFFHFSSFDENNPQRIAQKQTRFLPGSRPDICKILTEYSAELVAAKGAISVSTKYGFDFFDDGVPITAALRRIYAALRVDLFHDTNPFTARGKVWRFARKHGFLSRSRLASKRTSFRDIGEFRSQEAIIGFFLRMLLRVVGPDRYFGFMRYLAYISSIRNQKHFFNR